MKMMFWHSEKFRKDFYKHYNYYGDNEMYREQRDFVLEYEQEIIDIKKSYRFVLVVVLINLLMVSLITLKYGIFNVSTPMGALFILGCGFFKYHESQITLSKMSREMTKDVYDELIKEKYNL